MQARSRNEVAHREALLPGGQARHRLATACASAHGRLAGHGDDGTLAARDS